MHFAFWCSFLENWSWLQNPQDGSISACDLARELARWAQLPNPHNERWGGWCPDYQLAKDTGLPPVEINGEGGALMYYFFLYFWMTASLCIPCPHMSLLCYLSFLPPSYCPQDNRWWDQRGDEVNLTGGEEWMRLSNYVRAKEHDTIFTVCYYDLSNGDTSPYHICVYVFALTCLDLLLCPISP